MSVRLTRASHMLKVEALEKATTESNDTNASIQPAAPATPARRLRPRPAPPRAVRARSEIEPPHDVAAEPPAAIYHSPSL